MLLALYSVQQDDLTIDEQDHYNYGVQVLKGNSQKPQTGFDFNTTMPVSALNAFPRAVHQVIEPSLKKSDYGVSDTRAGRYITIFFSLLLLGYIFAFARQLGGSIAGNIAVFIAAVDPNLLAHGRLVTTDMYSALAFTATLYHLYCWIYQQQKKHFYYWCAAIAIAQCCKINAILLYPISLIILLERAYTLRGQFKKKSIGAGIGIFIAGQILIINACYFFEGFGTSLHAYTFKSAFFSGWKETVLGSIPLPLPTAFVQTFDLTQFERETFTGTAQNYLLGELRYKEGFWNYYLICFMVKTPLLLQLGMGAVFGWALWKKAISARIVFFLGIPTLITLLLLSRSDVQNGYRYLLPVLVLLLIFIGMLLGKWGQKLRPSHWTILAVIYAFPLILQANNYIAYTSEWLWPKRSAWKYVADSNLNWGQKDKQIRHYLKQHPEIIVEPAAPVRGKVMVDVNQYTGIIETEKYKWLRENYRPVAVVEGCFLLFDIP